MKSIFYAILASLLVLTCAEPPTQFTQEALSEKAILLNGNTTSLSKVFETYKGKTVLVDIWASWCGDCIKGMPLVKEIQKSYNDVDYVFLSVDRNETAWKRGIKRYNVIGDHYFLPNGQDGTLGAFLNSNWIPRYMVIDKKGSIKLFKATKASDKSIIEALK